MGKRNTKYLFLRVLAGSIMALVTLVLVALAFFVILRLHNNSFIKVQNGLLSPTSQMLIQQPLNLQGSWDSFEGVVCASAQDVQALGQNAKRLVLPIGAMTQAQKDASYRLYLALPSSLPEEPLYLAIPNYDGSLEVFVNGARQLRAPSGQNWISFHSLTTTFALTNFDPNQKLQELVISGSFSNDYTTLLHRPILLGTMQNISTMVTFNSSTETLILGMLLLVLMNGYVFMLFRPGHLLISIITVFDTLLMCRLFPTMNYAISIFRGMLPNLVVHDRTFVSVALFSLMLAGFVGCLLAKELFDPKGIVPWWLVRPPAVCYLIFAVVFPFQLKFFEQYGVAVLVAIYLYTFVGVFCEFLHCWKNTNRRGYFLFQFIKTAYIGCLVFFDISRWNQYTDISIWLYLYSIFFVMHVIVRLYDNNSSYQSVELLNRNLEKTVEERTRELLRANQVLSELSIRDPLTTAYNRLYFEEQMERVFSDPKDLYLCIFDLDFFKRINDSYGHPVGDQMLRRLTAIVQQTAQENVIFARIGGEEFVLLYENQPLQKVLDSIFAIHKAVEENALLSERYTTASFGVAAWKEGDTSKSLLQKADAALYQAKNNGRNQVALHPEIQRLQDMSLRSGETKLSI